jgi:hypothetical protein
MAVTIYENADGLIQKYGTSEAKSLQQGGWVCTYGPYLSYIWNLDLTTLTTSETIQNDVLVIPKNSLIVSVEVLTVVAAAAGTAIDVGLISISRDTTTDLNGSIADSDPNGLLEALAAGDMSESGEYFKFWDTTAIPVADVAHGGALLGEILTTPTVLTASRTDATAFTAGQIMLRVDVLPEALIGWGEVH